MNAQVFSSVGEKNLKNFTLNMRKKAVEENQSKLSGYGIRLLTLKLKLVPLTCFTKIIAIQNQTSKTLAQLRVLISALKLSSILIKMKLQFVILLQSVFLSLQITKQDNLTMKVYIG